MNIKNINPKISVIIPVFNVEKYLRECLDSILNQTLQDIEIICVNDGSTDSSLEILEEYAKSDKRILICDQENRGLSEARNTGAENAKGEYLYFLDSDDKVRTDALEKLYDLSKALSLDVLYFDGESFFENQEIEQNYSSYKNFYKRIGRYDYLMEGKDLFVSMLDNNEYRTQVSLCFINRQFYCDEGLNFFPGVLHEDNLFTAKCMLKAKRVMHVSDAYFLRRVRADSIMTSSKKFAHAYGYFKCAMELFAFASNQNFGVAVHKCINRLFVNMINSALSIYYKLNLDEQKLIDKLNCQEKELFNRLVIRPHEKEIQYLKSKLNEQEAIVKNNKKEIQRLQKSLDNLKNSRSYRIGRAITWLPRKVRDVMK